MTICTCDDDVRCDECVRLEDERNAEAVATWGSLEAARVMANLRWDLETARCGGPWAEAVWAAA